MNKKRQTKSRIKKVRPKKHGNYLVVSLIVISIITIITTIFYSIKKSFAPTDIFVVGTETGTTSLELTPANLILTKGVEATITLSIDAGTSNITSAAVEIEYDSSKFEAPTITQGDYFQTALIPASVDNNKIKFTYTNQGFGDGTKTGSGTLATIAIIPTVAGTSTLSFTENTIILSQDSQENSLKSVINATVNTVDASASHSISPSPSPSVAPQKPAKPTGLRSNCYDGGNKITLRWDSVAGVSSYKVRMDLLSGTPDISVDNITTTEYEAGIKPGEKYSWWVHSTKDGLDSEEAKVNEVICVRPSSAPTTTPTATPNSTPKTTAKPSPSPTPKTSPKATPQSTTKAAVTSSTPSPSAIGSLNDIFGQKPQEESETPSSDTSLLTKIALGWQAIFLKLAELFQ